MEEYKFSVAMCVYGGDTALFFTEALESTFNQTKKPDELVLVVDGPIPLEIENIIKKYSFIHSEMMVYRLEKNQGHGKARQLAISKCKYEYVAIVDSDDINKNNRFEVQIEKFIQNPNLSALSSSCYHFSDSIDNILNEEHLPSTDTEIKKYLKTRCPLCQASAMVKKSAVEKAGGYQDWYHAEDYYLWIRMYLNGAEFANINESLLYVRSDPAQMNRRGGIKYFCSMRKLYRFMVRKKIIGVPTYIYNVSSRFILQVLMPASVRSFIRKKLL